MEFQFNAKTNATTEAEKLERIRNTHIHNTFMLMLGFLGKQ